MKLLDKLVLSEVVPMFFVGVGLFFGIAFTGGTLVTASRWLAEGIPGSVVMQFILYSTPQMLGYTLPTGMLIAVLVGFGRLSSNSETVAVFAAGISFGRTALPVVVFAVAVSAAGYVFNDPLASYGNHRIEQLKDQRSGGHTEQPFDFPDFRSRGVLQAKIHVEKGFDLRTGVMKQVTIVLYSPAGPPTQTIYAARAEYIGNIAAAAEIEDIGWRLEDVEVETMGTPPTYTEFNTISSRRLGIAALDVSADDVALLQSDPEGQTFAQLSKLVAHFRASKYANSPAIRFDEVVMWSKLALPLAALVFTLIGAPLSLRPVRTSSLTGWILAVPMIMLYWVSSLLLTSLAQAGLMPPFAAAFLPDMVGAAFGSFMILRRTA